jgi:adenosylmethionine-8-amino-7-oxononanoate aminotransferase
MGRLREIDLKYVWHPFTQMRDFEPDENLIIVRGSGNYLFDEDGRSFFDATSSLWVSVHGHNHPDLNAAVRRQLGKIAHSTLLGIGNEPSALLAEKLVAMAPGELNRVFFSDNGSTAMEVALKMAFQYHRHKGAKGRQRSRFVALSNGYHGDTLGAVSVGGISLFHSIFSPLLFHTYFAPSPNCYRCLFGKQYPGCDLECVNAMDQVLEERGEEVAAVVVEPLVQAAGGMVVYPEEVLRGYFQVTKKHGVLFIADEVATGFGRTGEMFACRRAGIPPDLMAVAKGLTAGYLPVAATMVTQEVYDAFLGDFSEYKTFFHGHTYTGNPLGCAAAFANLELVEKPEFLAGVVESGKRLHDRLGEVARHEHVGDVRLVGLMGGIELVQNRESKEPFPYERRTGHVVCLKAREAGVFARPLGDVIVLMPPLGSRVEEIDFLVDALQYALDHTLGCGKFPAPKGPQRRNHRFGALWETARLAPVRGTDRLLVTGTDTGVGKTVVTACIAAAAARLGDRGVLCYKPVETGVAPGSSEGDAPYLEAFSTLTLTLPRYSSPQPLAPNIAARQEDVAVDFLAITDALCGLAAGCIALVEGAGGIMVPITDEFSFADLAREGGLAVLIVVPNRLGCINHTLLTVRAANDLGLGLAGIVLNNGMVAGDDSSVQHNERELKRLLGELFVGTVPKVRDILNADELADAGKGVAEKLFG